MNKRMIINLIASLIAFIVSTGINFLLTPYITDTVGGTAAYGFVGLANNIISYISIVTLALTSMSGRYITISIHEEDYKKANIYFNSVLIASILLGVIIILFSGGFIFNLELFLNIPQEIAADVKMLFTLLIGNFIVGLVGTSFSVATFSTNRLDLSSLRGIESNILRAGILVVMFMLLRPSIIYIGVATLAATAYVTISNVYYTKKLLPYISLKKKYFSFIAIREIIQSGLWNVFNRLSSILSTGLDLLITNLFVGSTQMGILSISKTLPTMILSLFAMLANVFAPQITASFAKGDMDGLKKHLFTAMKLLGVISCIPMAILIVYGKEFYQLWLPNENAELLKILSLVACVEYIFVLPLEPLWNIFTATNKIKIPAIYMFINSIFSVTIVFILLGVVEDEVLKLIVIAGVSTIFSIIRALIFLPIYGAKCVGFKWNIFYSQIFKSTMSVVIVTVIATAFRYMISVNNWIMLIVVSAITSIISIIINYFLILEKDDREFVKSIVYKSLKIPS
ncbi:MAG: MATE family efflux transporter [Turicibacter sp.]|nr:MATE family efflux transporter [Turicibacter sp.]